MKKFFLILLLISSTWYEAISASGYILSFRISSSKNITGLTYSINLSMSSLNALSSADIKFEEFSASASAYNGYYYITIPRALTNSDSVVLTLNISYSNAYESTNITIRRVDEVLNPLYVCQFATGFD